MIASTNICLARGVLPKEGWEVGGLYCRELTWSDLPSLLLLGAEDPGFSWERVQQDPSYYENLLRFRLWHYEQYSFGVHGVLLGNRLIGQCGLQVLDESADRVELVVFLARSHTHQRLGSTLARHVVRECRRVGMDSLYGTVRPNNSGGVALVKSLQGTLIEEMVYFRETAQVYRIDFLQGDE